MWSARLMFSMMQHEASSSFFWWLGWWSIFRCHIVEHWDMMLGIGVFLVWLKYLVRSPCIFEFPESVSCLTFACLDVFRSCCDKEAYRYLKSSTISTCLPSIVSGWCGGPCELMISMMNFGQFRVKYTNFDHDETCWHKVFKKKVIWNLFIFLVFSESNISNI